jgi:hypothetical protein
MNNFSFQQHPFLQLFEFGQVSSLLSQPLLISLEYLFDHTNHLRKMLFSIFIHRNGEKFLFFWFNNDLERIQRFHRQLRIFCKSKTNTFFSYFSIIHFIFSKKNSKIIISITWCFWQFILDTKSTPRWKSDNFRKLFAGSDKRINRLKRKSNQREEWWRRNEKMNSRIENEKNLEFPNLSSKFYS